MTKMTNISNSRCVSNTINNTINVETNNFIELDITKINDRKQKEQSTTSVNKRKRLAYKYPSHPKRSYRPAIHSLSFPFYSTKIFLQQFPFWDTNNTQIRTEPKKRAIFLPWSICVSVWMCIYFSVMFIRIWVTEVWLLVHHDYDNEC